MSRPTPKLETWKLVKDFQTNNQTVRALDQVDVHVDPWEPHGAEAHARTAGHTRATPSQRPGHPHPDHD